MSKIQHISGDSVSCHTPVFWPPVWIWPWGSGLCWAVRHVDKLWVYSRHTLRTLWVCTGYTGYAIYISGDSVSSDTPVFWPPAWTWPWGSWSVLGRQTCWYTTGMYTLIYLIGESPNDILIFLSPLVHFAQWAHIRRFLSVRLSVRTGPKILDNNSYLKKY